MEEGQEQHPSPEDLLAPGDIQNRLIDAILADELAEVLVWTRLLEQWGKQGLIGERTEQGQVPLVVACSKEFSRVRDLIIRVLVAKGATLPKIDGGDLELVRAWAIEAVESAPGAGNKEDVELKQLLSLSEAEAAEWIYQHLEEPQPSPTVNQDGVENQMSLYEDDAYRAASMPAEYGQQSATAEGSELPRRGGSVRPVRAESEVHYQTQMPFSPRKPKPIRPTSSSAASTSAIPTGHTSATPDVLDLTLDDSPPSSPKQKVRRSPSARPVKVEEDIFALPTRRLQSSTQKRPRSRTPVGNGADHDRYRIRQHSPAPRSPPSSSADSQVPAHVRIDKLPSSYSTISLDSFLGNFDIEGITDTNIHASNSSPWALVSFTSLALAQKAQKTLSGKRIEGVTIELGLFEGAGTPVVVEQRQEPPPPQQQQQTSVRKEMRASGALPPQEALAPNGGGGGRRGGMLGGSCFGGSGAYEHPPVGQNGGGGGDRYGGGGGDGGAFQPRPRYFPRPRVPIIFTAAELARRVYLGSLRYGTTEDEVADLFSQRAGVVARVLRVIAAADGSHSFAFVQLPDSITCQHSIKVLHGTVHEGHLLQVEHVNELNHRWLFSLALHHLPLRWQFRDVSDFLISTIGSFAGLIVNRMQGRLAVRVELRYKTELKWAAQELNGLVVDEQGIEAVIEQPFIRAEMDREMAYKRLLDEATSGAGGGGGYDPHQPGGANGGGGGGGGGGGYERDFPHINNNGGATPGGSTSRRVPPPPPPALGGGAASPMIGTTNLGPVQTANPEEYNPFAPSFMLGKK